MLDFFKNATGKIIHDFRTNFYERFLDKRDNCIENQVNKIYKEKKMDKDMIQTRLNDKILIFQKSIYELERKDKHQIITSTAKDRKG